MITVCTLLWDANRNSLPFSRMYDEEWVVKLYQGFARNLTVPWRFVVYTDRERQFGWPIEQRRLNAEKPGYGDCIQPYEMNEPMILCGLDTVVTGNCDEFAAYCLSAPLIALPRDPVHPKQACNGVSFVPAGKRHVWERWHGENDMDHMRAQAHVFIDDMWPGQVVSYKGSVKRVGLEDARIVYFHGEEKPHQLGDRPWIREHWNGGQ